MISFRKLFHIPSYALLLAVLMVARPLAAEPVTLNLKNADINALIASIAEITGRNFIVDPRVKGRVTVISGKPMDEDEIYQVFLSILAVHGFAAIPGDGLTKIIPAAGAKQAEIPTVGSGPVQIDDQVVTRVIQVENVSAAQIVPILRPLIPPQGHLAAYAPTNVLIVSDTAANVDRIATIIQRIDLASTAQVEIVPLQNASASEVVRILNTLEQGQAQGVPGAAAANEPARLVADERTNSILISGDTASRVRLRALIAHLDTPLQDNGNTQVIYLRYAQATELVPILQGISQTLNRDPANAPAAAQGQGGADAANLLDIQADESTNALVITAQPAVLRSLKTVISQLDVRRAQVLIEAVIAEISSDVTAELGVQWVVDGSGDGSAVGFTNFGNAGLTLGSVAAAVNGGTLPSALPNGAAIALGSTSGSVRFGALISALTSDADTNILSTPTLVTLDNEEAEIIVGQNVPFVTGSYVTDGSGTSSNPFQTIQREDVGLTLRVKPQINEGSAVKLEIAQEVSSVQPSSQSISASDIITNKRSIKTNVLVEDGQILVLGGLVDDNLSESVQKVPGLGDIPVVGNLFRSRRTTRSKRNLMVFLHPVILRDSNEGTLRSNDKYSYIREQQFLARQRGVGLLPQVQTPVLTAPEQVAADRTLIDLKPKPIAVEAPPPPKEDPWADIGFNNK